jgi:hypothetical protein
VFHKYGEQLGGVGRWWSGQQKRVLSGIDGLLLLVVIGDGRLVVPVDFAIRRPDPVGPGAPCRDKLSWARVMLDECLAACGRRGVELPAPMVVADSWFGDSKLMQHVGEQHQAPCLLRGNSPTDLPWPMDKRSKDATSSRASGGGGGSPRGRQGYTTCGFGLPVPRMAR